MLRLIKYLSKKQVFMFVLLLAFLVLQVFCDVTMPTYTARIVEEMQAGAPAADILITGGIMLAFAAGSVLATILETFLSVSISTGLGRRLRGEVFSHVLSLSDRAAGKFSAGSLLTRTTNDVQQVVSAMVLSLRLGVGAPLMAGMAIVRIAQSSGELTLVTAAAVVILLAGIMAILMVTLPRFKLIQKLTDRLNGTLRDTLTGIRVVRAYNAEEYERARFEEVSASLKRHNTFAGRAMALMNPLMLLIFNGLTLAIYWLGCFIIVRDNNAAFFPEMFSFTQLASQVVTAFMVLIMLFNMVPRAQVSAKRILEVLDETSELSDPASPAPYLADGSIEMKNVSASYGGAPVLSGVSFRVERGQTLAVVGGTGAGKTTLLKLILRFLDADTGEVLVGGSNVRGVPQGALRQSLGYAPQKSVLLAGTVGENIAFTEPSLPASALNEAAETACAAEFIAEKGGLSAEVAQGGRNFSGGQRQRLSIARAIAKKPPVVLFDDSFSALDFATDAKVRRNLKERLPAVTKVIVAQRISTVRDADVIVVLDHGKMAGAGTHEELLKNCPEYREIAESQLSKEELAR